MSGFLCWGCWKLQHLCFPQRIQTDLSAHRTIFHLASLHFKWALTKESDRIGLDHIDWWFLLCMSLMWKLIITDSCRPFHRSGFLSHRSKSAVLLSCFCAETLCLALKGTCLCHYPLFVCNFVNPQGVLSFRNKRFENANNMPRKQVQMQTQS